MIGAVGVRDEEKSEKVRLINATLQQERCTPPSVTGSPVLTEGGLLLYSYKKVCCLFSIYIQSFTTVPASQMC